MVQGKRSPGKELLFGVLAISVVLLGTALVLEVGLRLLGYGGAPESLIINTQIVDDPILDWRYKPNTQSQWGKVVYDYNGTGFRGESHGIEKPAGVVRVVVIGDSVTEGYGVEWRDVFASNVQAKLGAGYEIVSLGMGGLNTPQEVHILEEVGVRYRPDYVVVNFVLNDCDFFSSAKAGAKHTEDNQSKIALLGIRINPGVKRALKSSALLYLVNGRIADLWGRLKGEERHDYYGELWRNEANRAKVTTAFEKLRLLSHDHGFKVVVLVWPLVIDYGDYKFQGIHQWILEQAAANQFVGIDLLPVFSTQPFRTLQVTSEDYVHPNAVGHSLAAAEFVRWLTQFISSSHSASSVR
ncbi:MAG: SGNH/GDSL hydrolase family protein [Nitrospira sp.]|nr:SGNH/GDSL hydrolase family protein [Nitrospira sp.]